VRDAPSRTPAADAPASAGAAGPSLRRRRRWPWALLAAGLALGVLARAVLPAAVERGAAWASRHWLGLPVSIANADFELLAGRVVLEGLALGARPDGVSAREAALRPPAVDPASALLSVRRVSGRLSWRDLAERTLRWRELSIEAPVVRALREADGRVDPLRHARPAAPAAHDEAARAEREPSAWTLALDRFEVRDPDLRVVDETTAGDVVELALERFGLERVVWKAGELALGGVGIEGPVLLVRRDLLLARPAQPAPPPPVAAPAPSAPAAPVAPLPVPAPAAPPDAAAGRNAPPAYHIARLDVEHATFTWLTDEGPLDVAVALKATDVTAEEGRRFPLDVRLEIGAGTVHVTGDVGLLPPAWTGRLAWSGLPIPRLLVASVPQYAAWLRRAESSGDLAIDADFGGARGEPATRAAGRLTFDALAVEDPKGNEVTLGWRQLEVVAREVYAPLPVEGRPLGTTRAVLDLVKLVEPELRYTRPSPQLDALLGIDLSGSDGSGAAGAVGAPSDAAPEAAPPPAPEPGAHAPPPREGAPLELEIAALEATGGEVEALDRTVTPPARARVRGLSLRVKDVRYPAAAAAQVRLLATLPERATLDVGGSLRAGDTGEFTLKLGRLDLPVLNPYANAAAGATVDRGEASVDAKLALRGAAMRLDADLVLHQVSLSLRDPATFERQFGVPLDLALALLRDRRGDIRLHLPVSVDEQGTTLGLRSAFASALRAAVVGAVSSPLKMLGAAGPDGAAPGGVARGFAAEPLPSPPGAAALEADPGERLDAIATLARERPALRFALRGLAGEADRPIVAERLLVERVQRGDELPELEGTGFFSRRRIAQALERRAEGGTPELDAEDQALYERYVAAVRVPEERLAALAAARAAAVRDQLVARGVDAGRLPLGPHATDASPGVSIGLGAGG